MTYISVSVLKSENIPNTEEHLNVCGTLEKMVYSVLKNTFLLAHFTQFLTNVVKIVKANEQIKRNNWNPKQRNKMYIYHQILLTVHIIKLKFLPLL